MIRHLLAEARYQLGMARVHASYWIRPYDMTLDRRRWRWERRGLCGRQWLAAMSPDNRAVLERALTEFANRRDDTGRGGAT